jgi:cystathionine beta-lyase/cystathionine gamma-synthase
VNTPIHRSATFRFASTEDLLEAARGRRPGYYGRYGHPNFAVVERKFAALHGAEDAVLFGSGMAAIAATLQGLARPGHRIVALRDLYGGTRELLGWLAMRAGIEVTWVRTEDRDALARALPGARILVAESPTNPLLKVVDPAALSSLARSHGAITLFDNTFATPVNQRPLASGIDLVVESATKFLGGHGDLLGGLVAGRASLLAEVRTARKVTGGISDPGSAWLLERGMKTLAARVERQNRTGLEIARRLAADRRVARVVCVGHPDHPDRAVVERLGLSSAGLVTMALRGGYAAARRLADSVRRIANAPSLGGVESLLSLPVHTSHAMFSPEERREAGIGDDRVRLSLGLEDPDDLWEDLDRALGA